MTKRPTGRPLVGGHEPPVARRHVPRHELKSRRGRAGMRADGAGAGREGPVRRERRRGVDMGPRPSKVPGPEAPHLDPGYDPNEAKPRRAERHRVATPVSDRAAAVGTLPAVARSEVFDSLSERFGREGPRRTVSPVRGGGPAGRRGCSRRSRVGGTSRPGAAGCRPRRGR